MRFILTTLVILIIQTIGKSQDRNWDVYLAQYEKGPGSTTLNLDLMKTAPKQHLPFIVITGITYTECDDNGFPTDKEFSKLYDISDHVQSLISSTTQSELAGTFTYQCERLDYLYVQDTLNLRNSLTELYTNKYKSYKYYVNIKPDKDWEAYLKFLYPNEEILEHMANEKILIQLRLAGDKLNKPRAIDHWLYFANNEDRSLFIKYATKENFKINSKDYIKDSALPYQLHISRTDNIDVSYINKLTLELKQKAMEFKGKYDGWETIVLKD